MPSKSPAQARTMAAIAHGDRTLGKKLGIPAKVAEDFNRADAGTGILRRPRRRAPMRTILSSGRG